MASEASARAAQEARRVGDRALEADALAARSWCASATSPYATVVGELERLAARFPGETMIQARLAFLRALAACEDGRREQAAAHLREAIRVLRRIGQTLNAAVAAFLFGRLEAVAGHVDEAETIVVDARAELQELGDRGYFSSATTVLAEIRIAQGRFRDALQLAAQAEEAAGSRDRVTLIEANAARGRAYAQLGRIEQAKAAATEAVRVAASTEATEEQACAQYALAEVLAAADELPAALSAASEAARLYAILERRLEKRRVARLASRIRPRLATTRQAVPAA